MLHFWCSQHPKSPTLVSKLFVWSLTKMIYQQLLGHFICTLPDAALQSILIQFRDSLFLKLTILHP